MEPLLLRTGRVLTPRSRLTYRLARLRGGKVTGFESGDELAVAALLLRLVSLPLVTVVDFVTWPAVRRVLGRGPWSVVKVRFHGPDAEFVRIAEASTRQEAQAKLEEIEHGRVSRM